MTEKTIQFAKSLEMLPDGRYETFECLIGLDTLERGLTLAGIEMEVPEKIEDFLHPRRIASRWWSEEEKDIPGIWPEDADDLTLLVRSRYPEKDLKELASMVENDPEFGSDLERENRASQAEIMEYLLDYPEVCNEDD